MQRHSITVSIKVTKYTCTIYTTTSSDINIEEKLHISMTNWISFSDEAVFRLLHVVCDLYLYFIASVLSSQMKFPSVTYSIWVWMDSFDFNKWKRDPPGMFKPQESFV